jgi:hypothetical protein
LKTVAVTENAKELSDQLPYISFLVVVDQQFARTGKPVLDILQSKIEEVTAPNLYEANDIYHYFKMN